MKSPLQCAGNLRPSEYDDPAWKQYLSITHFCARLLKKRRTRSRKKSVIFPFLVFPFLVILWRWNFELHKLKSRNFLIKLLLVTSVLALCRASTKLLAVCNSPSFGSSTATMLTIHWLHMAHFFGYVLPKNFGTPLPLVKGARRLLPPLPYSRCMPTYIIKCVVEWHWLLNPEERCH